MFNPTAISLRLKDDPMVRIHVVDADPAFHRTLKNMIAQPGGERFRLTFSKTLPHALAVIQKNGIDACLVDHGVASGATFDQLNQFENAVGHRPVILLIDAPSCSNENGPAVWRFTSDWLIKRELTPGLISRAVRYVLDVNATRRALIEMNDELERQVQIQTDQLRRRNEDLERFAFLVAHDLQAPLKTILAQCQSWKCEVDSCTHSRSDEFCSHFAAKAITNVERINCLIQRLLEYSRVGRDSLCRNRIVLDDVVQAALEELDSVIKEAGATIQCGPLPVVLGDQWLLVNVFENLLHNALKFRTDQPLMIHIEANPLDEVWEIQIRDNGIGVGAHDCSNIFELFSRTVDHTAYPGDGIGLATCRKIIEHHGGRIWAEPNANGGTAICFTLPRA